MLDDHFVARVEQCRHGEIIRHRCAFGRHHAIGIHAVLPPDRLLQRHVAVAARAVDLKRREIEGQFAHGERSHSTGSQVEGRFAVGLRPMHVVRMFVRHVLVRRRLQYKYTGMPVSKINQPFTEFAGSLQMVLATIVTQAITNSAVV
jgi:hypothetical protein